MSQVDRKTQVETVLVDIFLPKGINIRAWAETDFPAIQQLSIAEGWNTPRDRSDEAMEAWCKSWPALVITGKGELVGFLRALSDEHVTTYIAELLITPEWRGHGLGKTLVEVCQRLYPTTRLDLLSTESSDGFYEATEFRSFQGFRKSSLITHR